MKSRKNPFAAQLKQPSIYIALLIAAIFTYWANNFILNSPINFYFEVTCLQSSVTGLAQLFYDVGAGFREADSATASIMKSDVSQSYRFSLPEGNYRALRFDPIHDGESAITLSNAKIIDANSTILHTFTAQQFIPLQQIRILTAETNTVQFVTVKEANDPIFNLSFTNPFSLTAMDNESVSVIKYIKLLSIFFSIFLISLFLVWYLFWRDKTKLYPMESLIILLIVYITLAIIRTPYIMLHGRFWAEEAVIFFHDAINGSWYDALLAPHIGYYSAFNKIAALAATTVALENAPLVMVYFSLILQLFVILIIYLSNIFQQQSSRILALSVVILTPLNNEVWLTTTNSQFHFSLGAAILLVTTHGIPSYVRFLFLLLAGTTGPLSIFLTPLFIWRALHEPSNSTIREAFLLSLCALLQFILLFTSLSTGARSITFNLLAWISTFSIKNIALPFLGFSLSEKMANIILQGNKLDQFLVIIIVTCIGILFTSIVSNVPNARKLAFAGLILAILSIIGSLGNDPWINVYPFSGGRYFFAPNALFGLAMVSVATSSSIERWKQIAASMLIGAFLTQGLTTYSTQQQCFNGPDWQEEVRLWRGTADKTSLRVWPDGWNLTLNSAMKTR